MSPPSPEAGPSLPPIHRLGHVEYALTVVQLRPNEQHERQDHQPPFRDRRYYLELRITRDGGTRHALGPGKTVALAFRLKDVISTDALEGQWIRIHVVAAGARNRSTGYVGTGGLRRPDAVRSDATRLERDLARAGSVVAAGASNLLAVHARTVDAQRPFLVLFLTIDLGDI